jgi:hypothetical protein
MSDADLHAAWAAVHDAMPESWHVGRPSGQPEHPERGEWVMFAFDTRERPVLGKRAGEWTAVGQTELRCVQTVAHCLREVGARRWPK